MFYEALRQAVILFRGVRKYQCTMFCEHFPFLFKSVNPKIAEESCYIFFNPIVNLSSTICLFQSNIIMQTKTGSSITLLCSLYYDSLSPYLQYHIYL